MDYYEAIGRSLAEACKDKYVRYTLHPTGENLFHWVLASDYDPGNCCVCPPRVGTMLIGCALVRCTFDPRSEQRSLAPLARKRTPINSHRALLTLRS